MAKKFIEIGIQYQQNSSTKEEANKMFLRSCNICCNRGLHIDCDKCEIAAVHELTIAILDDLHQNELICNRECFDISTYGTDENVPNIKKEEL